MNLLVFWYFNRFFCSEYFFQENWEIHLNSRVWYQEGIKELIHILLRKSL